MPCCTNPVNPVCDDEMAIVTAEQYGFNFLFTLDLLQIQGNVFDFGRQRLRLCCSKNIFGGEMFHVCLAQFLYQSFGFEIAKQQCEIGKGGVKTTVSWLTQPF